LHVRLSLSEITSPFGLSRYLDRTFAQLSVLTCKALHTGQPCYLADLIDSYEPSRCLRSTNCYLLAVPSCAKSSFASRAFCVSSPNNWNSLPAHIRSSDSLVTFQSRLKSHLFSSAYHVQSPTRQRLRFDLRLLALYKYLIDIDIDIDIERIGSAKVKSESEVAQCKEALAARWVDWGWACTDWELIVIITPDCAALSAHKSYYHHPSHQQSVVQTVALCAALPRDSLYRSAASCRVDYALRVPQTDDSTTASMTDSCYIQASYAFVSSALLTTSFLSGSFTHSFLKFSC